MEKTEGPGPGTSKYFVCVYMCVSKSMEGGSLFVCQHVWGCMHTLETLQLSVHVCVHVCVAGGRNLWM